MSERQRLGASGERVAAHYLEQRGYRVIERNVRRAEGEIDLVAVAETGSAPGATDATLVFIEVKLRRSDTAGRAVEALSAAKQERLCRLAEGYAAEHPELPAVLRIDLLAIDATHTGAPTIEHIEGAVEG